MLIYPVLAWRVLVRVLFWETVELLRQKARLLKWVAGGGAIYR